MSTVARTPTPPGHEGDACGGHSQEGYRHEALFYADDAQFMAGTLSFIRGAVKAAEPILVVLGVAKIRALRDELEDGGERVLFADMAEVGANPARIIPAWEEFLARHAAPGRRLWGIGEPIWAARSPAELAECQRHEALLNVAFSDPAFSLLCPYDTTALAPEVVEEARRNHPFLREEDGVHRPSVSFPGVESLKVPFMEPLPPLPSGTPVLGFELDELGDVRRLIADRGVRAELSAQRIADMQLAVNEIATNSLRHGGGRGTVSVWQTADALVCEVRDAGRIEDPMVGRRAPSSEALGGRGIWLANQLCELVQVRTFAEGGVVRLHMHL